MIVHLSVTKPNGDTSQFEFRRPTIRVGAGSRNDLVLQAGGEVVRLLQLDFEKSGFRVTPLTDVVPIHVIEDGKEPRAPEKDLILRAGTVVRIGEDETTRILVENYSHDDRIAISSLGELKKGSSQSVVADLNDEMRKQVLALSYMISGKDDPSALVSQVNEYLTRGDTGITAIQLCLPAGEDGQWDQFRQFGPGTPNAILDAVGFGHGDVQSELLRSRVVCASDRDTQTILVPVASDSRLYAVFVLLVEGDPEAAFTNVKQHLRALRPLAISFGQRYRRAAELIALKEENRYFRERQRRHYLFKDLVTNSVSMRRLHRDLGQLVTRDGAVLLTGEAGTGKELLARALHHLGGRAGGIMIAQHCGTSDEDQLDFELFGYVRTNDKAGLTSRRGIFELASGGTVFLDEIHALSPRLQTKLHRVLVEGEIFRIGESLARSVDIRVVAATHQDLSVLADEGKFRRDLAVLLTKNQLVVPPLRDRREDIEPLMKIFLKKFAKRYRKDVLEVDSETSAWLTKLRWPGNVRELLTVIERAVLQASPGQTVLARKDFELR